MRCPKQNVREDADKRREWGAWVEIKTNAVHALQRESHKLIGKRVFLPSATDSYQPIEQRLGLTRALLEGLLLAFPTRLHIQTRSPHAVRDLDLFQRFGETITVGVSIPTDSEVVRKVFEPRVPSLSRRLHAAKTLGQAGIITIASIALLLSCTPTRLARRLRPCFDRAWIEPLHFYDKAAELRVLYSQHG